MRDFESFALRSVQPLCQERIDYTLRARVTESRTSECSVRESATCMVPMANRAR